MLACIAWIALHYHETMTSALSQMGRAPLFCWLLHLYLQRTPDLINAVFVCGPDRPGPPPIHSDPEWAPLKIGIKWIFANLVLVPITGWYARARKRLGRLCSYLRIIYFE